MIMRGSVEHGTARMDWLRGRVANLNGFIVYYRAG